MQLMVLFLIMVLVTLNLKRGRILFTVDCGMPNYRAACLSDFFILRGNPSRTSLAIASVTWFTGAFIFTEAPLNNLNLLWMNISFVVP